MSTYYITEPADYLTASAIDKAIEKGLEYLTERYGTVELVGTSMVIQRELLFVTVIARSVEERE